jgi:hypothetical protein
LSFIQRNNLAKEPFSFKDKKADRLISSLEKGMKVHDQVLRNGRSLGDGPGGLDAEIYGEEWPMGAALEKFVLEHWDDDESEEAQDRDGT